MTNNLSVNRRAGTSSNVDNNAPHSDRPDFVPLQPRQRPADLPELMGVTQEPLPPGLHQQVRSSRQAQMAPPVSVSHEASLPASMQQIAASGLTPAMAANPANQKPTVASYYIAALESFFPHKTPKEVGDMYSKHLDSLMNKALAEKREHEAGEEGYGRYQSSEHGNLEKLALTRCMAELVRKEAELSIQQYDNAALLESALDYSKEKKGMLTISEEPYVLPLHKSEELKIWVAAKRKPDGTGTTFQPLMEMLARLPTSVSLELTLCQPQKKNWMPEPNAASIPDALKHNHVHAKEYITYLDQVTNTRPRSGQNAPSISPEFIAAIGKEVEKFSQWAANKRYALALCDVRTLNQLVDTYCEDEFPEHEHQEASLRSICLNAYVEWRSADHSRAFEKNKVLEAAEMGKLVQLYEELEIKSRRRNLGNHNVLPPGETPCVVM